MPAAARERAGGTPRRTLGQHVGLGELPARWPCGPSCSMRDAAAPAAPPALRAAWARQHGAIARPGRRAPLLGLLPSLAGCWRVPARRRPLQRTQTAWLPPPLAHAPSLLLPLVPKANERGRAWLEGGACAPCCAGMLRWPMFDLVAAGPRSRGPRCPRTYSDASVFLRRPARNPAVPLLCEQPLRLLRLCSAPVSSCMHVGLVSIAPSWFPRPQPPLPLPPPPAAVQSPGSLVSSTTASPHFPTPSHGCPPAGVCQTGPGVACRRADAYHF